MANSRTGNYQLEFQVSGYTSPVRVHGHAVYVAPTAPPVVGTPASGINVQLKGGGNGTLQAFANSYCSFMTNLYPTSVTLTQFTLWRYISENSRDFVAAGVAVPTTTGSGTLAVAHQKTLTYRTAGGAILKQIFLEGNSSSQNKSALEADSGGNGTERMAAFVLSATSAVIGIDNTFAVAPLFNANGENEKIFRKVFRG